MQECLRLWEQLAVANYCYVLMYFMLQVLWGMEAFSNYSSTQFRLAASLS